MILIHFSASVHKYSDDKYFFFRDSLIIHHSYAMAEMKCHFLRLPAEIRLCIYQYLVPTNKTITFTGTPTWVSARFKPHKSPSHTGPRRCYVQPTQHELEICLPFFCVNHMIYNELMDILYGENKFVFQLGTIVQGRPWLYTWEKAWINSFSLPFGGDVSALRWFKQCELVLLFSDPANLGGELRKFVDEFASAFVDSRYPYRLRKLTVSSPRVVGGLPERVQYMLEPLAKLRGLESVVIPTVDEPYSRKLESVMMGSKKRKLSVLEYGERVYRRRKYTGGRTIITRTLKRYFDPEFDWSWELESRDPVGTATDHRAFGEQQEHAASGEETHHDNVLWGKSSQIYGPYQALNY
jgi:hypothetical protein